MPCVHSINDEKENGKVITSHPSVCLVFAQFQAIQSLNKYPLPLKSAKEAKILQNFGDGICKILDDKLQRYYRDNGNPWQHMGLVVVKHTCLHFFFSTFCQGAEAPIHDLPKGVPPPDRKDCSLDPSTKAQQQLFILMTNPAHLPFLCVR